MRPKLCIVTFVVNAVGSLLCSNHLLSNLGSKSFNVLILYSWGNREALTISLTCLYPSCSESIVTATDNHLDAKQ